MERKKAREEREKKRETKIQKMRTEALLKAKKEGKKVYIRTIGRYDGDEVHPGKELGWVDLVELATPEGKIVVEENPYY